MELSLKHYGNSAGRPSSIIELTADDYGNKITADITDLKGRVDENLIMALRDIADELEGQNNLIAESE